jgi:hypothetical protein
MFYQSQWEASERAVQNQSKNIVTKVNGKLAKKKKQCKIKSKTAVTKVNRKPAKKKHCKNFALSFSNS